MAKRAFDIIVSAAGLLLLSPVLLLIALIVRLTSPGPVLYRARRVGRDGQEFTLCKFRSMVDARQGPAITGARDPRVTPVGRVLRRAKLDELPQLFNALRGDMSLVGPRPEDPRYVALYTPAQRAILAIRPGITSRASLEFRHEEALLAGPDYETRYIQDIMPAKLAIDLDYMRRITLWGDIVIILRTLLALFR
jgi:lipopolysaccharide/colanic/teichoic acid biosynthesis glycosyltransferase